MKKNDWVYHNRYGVGRITTISAGYIYVDFSGQVKIFAQNDAHKHLLLSNDDKFVIVNGELKKYIGSAVVVKIPRVVSRIGEFAFANNTNLVSVDFNNSVFAIGDHAFENCSKLVAIQNCGDLIRIGSFAFNNCIKLTRIDLPTSVQIIEKSAFCDCGLLKEIFIPSGIKTIAASVFRGCSALEKITGMDAVTSIQDGAFAGCSKLHIDLPKGLEQIHNRAFYNCDKLHPLVIPESVTMIADDAFANNDRTIVLYGTPGSFAEKYARKQSYPFYNKKALPKPTSVKVTEEKNAAPLIGTISAIRDLKVEETKPVDSRKKVPMAVVPPVVTQPITSSHESFSNVPSDAKKDNAEPKKTTSSIHASGSEPIKADPVNSEPIKHETNTPVIDATAILPEKKAANITPPKPKTKKRKNGLLAAVITILVLLGTGYGVYHDRVNNIAQLMFTGEVQTNTGIYSGEMDWGIIHGTGTLQFPDGSFYEGAFDTGTFAGDGTFTWTDNSVYEGQWYDDLMNGNGHLSYSDGSQYEGDFLNGQRSGYGTYQWADSNTYEGEWLNDVPNGSGILETSTGTSYNGIFANGVFIEGTYTETKAAYTTAITFAPHKDTTFAIEFNDGTTVTGTDLDGGQECEISYSNGDSYEGTLVNGTRNGYGVFEWESGESYDGEWVNDEMTGKGTFTYADGSTLSGEFLSNSFITGTATICSSEAEFEIEITDTIPANTLKVTLSDGTEYSGTYTGNKLTGSGTITYSDGDKFVGAIVDGELQGKGVYTWSDGEKYDGNWSAGKMSGTGTYYYGSTQRLTGSFKDNEPYGTCYYYTSDGTRYTTYWTSNGMENIYKG